VATSVGKRWKRRGDGRFIRPLQRWRRERWWPWQCKRTTTLTLAGLVILLSIGGGAVVVHSIGGKDGQQHTVGRTVDLAAVRPPSAGGDFQRWLDRPMRSGSARSPSPRAGWVSDLMGRPNTPQAALVWWKPDGSSAAAPDLNLDQVYLPESPNRRPLRADLRRPPAPAGPPASDVSIRIPNSQGYASSIRHHRPRRARTNMGGVAFRIQTQSIDIRIGLAKGPWADRHHPRR